MACKFRVFTRRVEFSEADLIGIARNTHGQMSAVSLSKSIAVKKQVAPAEMRKELQRRAGASATWSCVHGPLLTLK